MKEVMEPAGIVQAGILVIRLDAVRVSAVAGTRAAATVVKPSGGVGNLLLEDGSNLLLESTDGVLLLE